MYRAKDRGGGVAELYDDAMRGRAARRIELQDALRHGLERGEMRLHYQPRVRLATGEIVGVEALVRWQHPERGLLSPAQFLPMAEESGLIAPLGTWVIEESCRQAARWADARRRRAAGGRREPHRPRVRAARPRDRPRRASTGRGSTRRGCAWR